MDLRHIENVVVDKAVLHIIDTGGDAPIFASDALDLGNEEVNAFVVNHILKSLTDDNAFRAKYIGETAMIDRTEKLLNNDAFMDSSKDLAERMFNFVTEHRLASCDLLIVKFHTEHVDAFGILKLDFRRAYTHELTFEYDAFKVKLVAQDIALPHGTQKIDQCAFGMTHKSESDYDLIVLNKSKGSDDEKGQFLSKFLNAQREFDYKDKTKTLRREVEKWTQNNLKDEFEVAEQLRQTLSDTLRTRAVISANDIIQDGFNHSAEGKHSLVTKLEQQGLDADEKFEVDKRFVQKRMKNKILRTDTGFIIKGDYELFEDDGFIEITHNGDGSVNYIIKNVRHIKER